MEMFFKFPGFSCSVFQVKLLQIAVPFIVEFIVNVLVKIKISISVKKKSKVVKKKHSVKSNGIFIMI